MDGLNNNEQLLTEERETIKLLAELIRSEMQLEEGVVAIYNQPRTLEPKSGLYIDVAILGMKLFGASTRPVNDPAQPEISEIQTVSQQEIYQIDIFSASSAARLRKVEIVFALTGTAAQQAQEKYAFKIGAIPSSFVDASEGEGSRRLNRYAITFNVLRAYSKAKSVPTFSVFQNPPAAILVNP